MTFGLTVPPRAWMESGRSCCWVIRRIPETTRNSGVTLVTSVAHAPPFLRTASSRMVGVPASIARRMRSSVSLSPSHVTVSVLSLTAAVRPGAALYDVKLHVNGSAEAAEVINRSITIAIGILIGSLSADVERLAHRQIQVL